MICRHPVFPNRMINAIYPRLRTLNDLLKCWLIFGEQPSCGNSQFSFHGNLLFLINCLCEMQHLEIRNSLDIMHCEKKFAENLLKTICGYKEKDSVRVRRDMEREGIRPHLWMVWDPNNASRTLKPAANYVLTPREFDIFCTRLENIKVPSDYCSEIGMHIRTRKFGALKSHDYHILMQSLLLLALWGLMDRSTRMAIMRSCRVFRRICSKV